MGKYLRKGFNLTDGDCWQTEHRDACSICNDSKASVAFGEFMYSCDCVQNTIYKLYDVDIDGDKDLLVQTHDKALLGESINRMAEFCSLEIHEINQTTGETKISRNTYSYSI